MMTALVTLVFLAQDKACCYNLLQWLPQTTDMREHAALLHTEQPAFAPQVNPGSSMFSFPEEFLRPETVQSPEGRQTDILS